MKIIFVVANMVGGGSERVIANLANSFVNRGMDVSILMTASNEVAYKLDQKIEITCIGSRTGGSLQKRLDRIKIIRQYTQKNKGAYIISFGTETNLFTILATRFLPNKLIISERNDPKQCAYKKLRNIIYGMANQFVFQTQDAKECFANRIKKRGIVIPNPIAKDIIEPFEGQRKKKVVAVGRLTSQKNHQLLLEAFSVFYKNNKQFSLIIYGKGELEDMLKERTRELGVEECVTFAGFRENVLEEIKDAAMYVLSSDYEGISNSLVEAMAVGMPVISTDCPIGGSRMCIKNGKNGILVPMGNASALVEAMQKIATDDKFSKLISLKAIEVRQKYSLENITDMWMEVLKKDY